MTIRTNDQSEDVAKVTKSANRVRKPAVAKFVPLPDPKNNLPTPEQQEGIWHLFQTYSAKDQAVIMSFVGSREFMAPGYGKAARAIKALAGAMPKAVKLG